MEGAGWASVGALNPKISLLKMSKLTTSPLPRPAPSCGDPVLGSVGISLPNANAKPSAGGVVPPPTSILKRAVNPYTGGPGGPAISHAPDWPLALTVSLRVPELLIPPEVSTRAVPKRLVPAGTVPLSKLNDSCG